MVSDRRTLLRLLADTATPVRRAGDEPYFRTSEVAAILQVSTRAVRSWADDGKLRCVRTEGGHRLFPAGTVRDAIERMRSAGRLS